MNRNVLRARLSRRDFLSLAAAGVGTASASGWLPVLAAHAAEKGVKHKSCILLYMLGGPSHIDTFDLKYDTETATEFQPIATSVPGYRLCEHMPQLSRQMHLATVVRSMNHSVNNSHAAAVYASPSLPSELSDFRSSGLPVAGRTETLKFRITAAVLPSGDRRTSGSAEFA